MVAVGAVILDRGKVLLVQRGQPPLKGSWSLPGGVVELGETIDQALRREVREETGLLIEPRRLVGVFDRIVPGRSGGIRFHYVIVDYLCSYLDGELQAASDADRATWAGIGEVSTCDPYNLDSVLCDLLYSLPEWKGFQ